MLEWRHLPMWETPARTALVVMVLFAIGLGLFLAVPEPGWAVLGPALVIFSLRSYWLPAHYRLDGAGVHVSSVMGTRTTPWLRVRRVKIAPGGVFLSPFPRPTRLEGFRGTLLLCPQKRCGEIAERCRLWQEESRHVYSH